VSGAGEEARMARGDIAAPDPYEKVVKPGDHPDFYHFAPPPGTSRESSIALDREGRFWHDGARVDHPALERALRSWIARHPDDGRPILTNGYDWCYFKVEDAPFIVTAVHTGDHGASTLTLFDETEEPLDPAMLSIGEGGVVYAKVKGGRFDARFSRHAQTQLAPILVKDDPPTLRVHGVERVIPERASAASGSSPESPEGLALAGPDEG
jgi:hypothetical protein